MDQALTLFGRPEKLTAFIQNVRGVGNPEVDDCVSRILLISLLLGCLLTLFTVYYPLPLSSRQ
jgi:hypothetical protein